MPLRQARTPEPFPGRLVAICSMPERNAPGALSVHVTSRDGTLSSALTSIPLRAPSWARWHGRSLLHVACEHDDGRIATVRVNRNAQGVRLELVASTPSGGNGPCHLELVTDRVLGVANYRDGRVGWVELDGAGSARRLVATTTLSGSGSVAGRQHGPHAHHIVPGRAPGVVSVVDLGSDSIVTYEWTGAAPAVVSRCALPAGTGPRHLVRDPHSVRAWVVGELSGDLLSLTEREPGAFSVVASQPISALGRSQAAHLELGPSGHILHVSSRGTDTLVAFDVSGAWPVRLAEVPTAAHPRHFAFVPGALLVAGLGDDTMVRHGTTPQGLPVAALRATRHRAPMCVAPEPASSRRDAPPPDVN